MVHIDSAPPGSHISAAAIEILPPRPAHDRLASLPATNLLTVHAGLRNLSQILVTSDS